MKYQDVIRELERQKAKKLQTIDQTDGRLFVSNYMDRIQYGFMESEEAQQEYDRLIKKYTKQLYDKWVADLKQTIKNEKTIEVTDYGLVIAQAKHNLIAN